jgi:hypothetical protein
MLSSFITDELCLSDYQELRVVMYVLCNLAASLQSDAHMDQARNVGAAE